MLFKFCNDFATAIFLAFLCPMFPTFVMILRLPVNASRSCFEVCYTFATARSSMATGHALFDILMFSLFEFALALFYVLIVLLFEFALTLFVFFTF